MPMSHLHCSDWKQVPPIELSRLIGSISTMPERTVKTAAELESIIIAELREHPECESAAVVVGPTDAGWDASLAGTEATIDVDCQERLGAITNKLRQKFDLAA
jgi:hypothetical protein